MYPTDSFMLPRLELPTVMVADQISDCAAAGMGAANSAESASSAAAVEAPIRRQGRVGRDKWPTWGLPKEPSAQIRSGRSNRTWGGSRPGATAKEGARCPRVRLVGQSRRVEVRLNRGLERRGEHDLGSRRWLQAICIAGSFASVANWTLVVTPFSPLDRDRLNLKRTRDSRRQAPLTLETWVMLRRNPLLSAPQVKGTNHLFCNLWTRTHARGNRPTGDVSGGRLDNRRAT